MIEKIKNKNIKHIIFLDDKNEKAMNKLENQLQKEVSLAQYKLDNISDDNIDLNSSLDPIELEKNKITKDLLKRFSSDANPREENPGDESKPNDEN